MPNTSQLANARQQLKKLALQILPAGRVSCGVKDIDPSTEFFQDITANDPYFLILLGSYQNWDFQQRTREIVVPCKMWYALSTNADYDGLAQEDLNESLLNALTDFNNWIGVNYGNCPPPHDVVGPIYEEPEFQHAPPIGVFTWEFKFTGTSSA